jgi:hypothetical protein
MLQSILEYSQTMTETVDEYDSDDEEEDEEEVCQGQKLTESLTLFFYMSRSKITLYNLICFDNSRWKYLVQRTMFAFFVTSKKIIVLLLLLVYPVMLNLKMKQKS